MKIDEVYTWLMDASPTESDDVRKLWSNMASYCYYINTVDFGGIYQQKLVKVLEKSIKYDILVPNSQHVQVLNLADHLKTDHVQIYIYKTLHNANQAS
tara:strand:+ start:1899 stop:2192 length:294 start_codon:yes stop_codon:yes gene_type:complete